MNTETLPAAEQFREQRRALAADRHRPAYHFLPPANWMNDPNGLIQWRGQYHLFYQYNPARPVHGQIHWGHAVSDDLAHWRDWPIALAPTPGGADKDGCWSGCAVDNQGVPTLIYTGAQPQVVCLATSNDGLVTWQKREQPVLAAVPEGLDAGEPWDFRDPFVWREEDGWYMVMASRVVGQGGLTLLYRSDDLVEWEYLRPLLAGDQNERTPFWTGSVWECPNFFRLGDRHLLIVSFQDQAAGELLYTGYFVGGYRDHRFRPSARGIVDYGGCFYAPLTMEDEQGRRLMWGWLLEGRSRAAQEAAGWAGVMTLPRVLTLGQDGRLGVEPAAELRQLRGRHYELGGLRLAAHSKRVLEGVEGDTLEIVVEFEPTGAARFGLNFRVSPDRAEETRLICDTGRGVVTLDTRRSSLDPEAFKEVPAARRAAGEAPLQPAPGETVRLHLFLDRSVVEVYVHGRVTLSGRIYPSRGDSLGIELFSEGGETTVKALDVWEVGAIWND